MKLYWRVKIDGKWTYKAAKVIRGPVDWGYIVEPLNGVMDDEVEMS